MSTECFPFPSTMQWLFLRCFWLVIVGRISGSKATVLPTETSSFINLDLRTTTLGLWCLNGGNLAEGTAGFAPKTGRAISCLTSLCSGGWAGLVLEDIITCWDLEMAALHTTLLKLKTWLLLFLLVFQRPGHNSQRCNNPPAHLPNLQQKQP